MSQIVDYADPTLEKRSIFLRLLERLIRDTNWSSEVDLGDVSLVNIKQVDTGKHDLSLGATVGLAGMTAAGSGAKKDPKLIAMQEVIDRLNELFGDEEFTDSQKVSFTEMALRAMLDNETLFTQAAKNTNKQFRPDLKPELLGSVADDNGAVSKIAEHLFSDNPSVEGLVLALAEAYWQEVQGRVGEGRGFGE
jgi:type I restriction enzyme R subunit